MNNNTPFWIMLAREGETTDGHHISAETLIALAESYSPEAYSARVYKSPSQSIAAGGLLSELRGEMLAAKVEIHNDTTYLYGLLAPTKYWFSVLSEDELVSVTIYPTICCVHKTSFTEKPYLIEVATTTAPSFPDIEPLNKHMVKA